MRKEKKKGGGEKKKRKKNEKKEEDQEKRELNPKKKKKKKKKENFSVAPSVKFIFVPTAKPSPPSKMPVLQEENTSSPLPLVLLPPSPPSLVSLERKE